MKSLLKQNAAALAGIVILIILYGFAKLPTISKTERQQLAQQFDFSQLALPEVGNLEKRHIREVNPSIENISGWISSVGASVALNDLDSDGLSNDLCYVEVRRNQVIVAPVPSTTMRYQPKTLTAAPLKYDNTMAPMGCLPADLNQDGRMDLLVYYWGRPPIAFMQAKQSFNFSPTEIVTSGFERWFTNAATIADIDGDGHLDIIIANYFQDGAHVLDPKSKIPVEMQHSMSRAYNAGGTYFFLWQEDNTYRRINGTEVLDKNSNYAWTLALGAADLDGDMLPELYFANDFGPDRLLHNRSTPGNLNFALLEGKRGFTKPASKVVGKDSFKGMGVDFADINSDGWLDIFVSNIAAEYALEESHFLFVSTGEVELMKQGIAPYVDLSEPLGVSRSDWSWDNKIADFNNDGKHEIIQTTGFLKGEINRWPELQQIAIGNDELLKYPQYWPRMKDADSTHLSDDISGHKPNPFYTRAANGRYINIAAELGLDQLQVSKGIAVADVDGDGDLDFALANQWEDSHFYRNNCPNGCGNYLGLHIRRTNNTQVTVYKGHPINLSSPAIGAAIKVTLPNKKVLVAQVDGGNGHSGKRSPDLHFGLNKIDSNLKVELSWRNSQGKVNQETLSLAPGWHTIEVN